MKPLGKTVKVKKVKETPEVEEKELVSFANCSSLSGTCGVMVLYGFPEDCEIQCDNAEFDQSALIDELRNSDQRYKLFLATLNEDQEIAKKFLKANGFQEIDNFDNPGGSNLSVFAFREAE